MAGVASGPDWILNGEMVNRTTSIMCIAPSSQRKIFSYFSKLGVLCAFAARPVEY